MRRVRSRKVVSNNPALMFAIGVEQLISDEFFSPSSHDAQELRKFQSTNNRQPSRENPFKVLFKQFTY